MRWCVLFLHAPLCCVGFRTALAHLCRCLAQRHFCEVKASFGAGARSLTVRPFGTQDIITASCKDGICLITCLFAEMNIMAVFFCFFGGAFFSVKICFHYLSYTVIWNTQKLHEALTDRKRLKSVSCKIVSPIPLCVFWFWKIVLCNCYCCCKYCNAFFFPWYPVLGMIILLLKV